MKCTITTLCENTVPISQELIGEHGLAFFVEYDNKAILFDTGQGIGLCANAEKLGKDLSSVSNIILSHGHYDHTGGLGEALERKPGSNLIAHPFVFQEKVAALSGKELITIGMPLKRDFLSERANVILTGEPYAITMHMMTTGIIPMKTAYEKVDDELFARVGEELVRDEILDDLSLILRTDNGIVIVVGCSHRGVVNIIMHVQKLTGEKDIHAVLGGMHLERASPEQLGRTIEFFNNSRIEKIVPSHCTGQKASAEMYKALGERVLFNQVGAVYEF